MQKITLSVVIPAYNEAEHLWRCLDSIIKQTVPPDEVVVVDNNSSDDTAKIAASFPSVTVISETKQGISHAHRAGFEHSTGSHIARIDADSVLPETWGSSIRNFYADPIHQVSCVRGSGIASNVRGTFFNKLIGDIAFVATDIAVGHRPLWGPCMVVPRVCWDAVKDNLCQEKPYTFDDLELSLHVHEKGFTIVWLHSLRVEITLRHTATLKKYIYYYARLPRTLKRHGSWRWPLGYATTLPTVTIYPFLKLLMIKKIEPEPDTPHSGV